jgi:hypothetical protein
MDTVTLILPDVAGEPDKRRVEDALRRLDGVRRAACDRGPARALDDDQLETAGLAVCNGARPEDAHARLQLTSYGKRLADKTLTQLRVALSARLAPLGLTPTRLVHDLSDTTPAAER